MGSAVASFASLRETPHKTRLDFYGVRSQIERLAMGLKRLFNSLLSGTHYRLVNKNDYDRIFACKDSGVDASKGLGRSITDDLQNIVGPQPRVIFDVGANKGGTYQMFRSLFPQATLYAFEPDPRVYAKLAARAASDPLAHLHQLAISETNAELAFHVTVASEKNSLLTPLAPSGPNPSAEANAVLEKIKVQSVSLDDFTAQQGIERIDLLKMDIEGGELRALEGARGLLSRFAIGCLYLELTFAPGYEGAPTASEVMTYLSARSYRLACLYNLQRSKASHALAYCDGLFVPARPKSAV
jgi:FkbM family methyltransferase